MHKKPFSRREFLSLAGATGGAALLAACQGVAPAPAGDAGDMAAMPVTVEVQSGWCTGGECDIWTPSIEMFNEKFPDITIEMIRVGVTPEDTMTAVAGGTAPDIYHRYIGGFSELMARGVMLPLDDLIANATDFDPDIYLGSQWDNGKWEGVTYGIPGSGGRRNARHLLAQAPHRRYRRRSGSRSFQLDGDAGMVQDAQPV